MTRREFFQKIFYLGCLGTGLAGGADAFLNIKPTFEEIRTGLRQEQNYTELTFEQLDKNKRLVDEYQNLEDTLKKIGHEQEALKLDADPNLHNAQQSIAQHNNFETNVFQKASNRGITMERVVLSAMAMLTGPSAAILGFISFKRDRSYRSLHSLQDDVTVNIP